MIYAIGGGVSFLAAMLATYIVMKVATRVGVFDHPDGQRKLQLRPVPVGGGVAILAAMGLATTLCVYCQHFGIECGLNNSTLWTTFFSGVIFITLVGLFDDIVCLRGRQKLAAQIGIALFMAQNGFAVERIVFLGQVVELGLLTTPLAMCWLIAAMNAFNLIDGVDGLAGLVGVIVGLSLVSLAVILQNSEVILMATILVGSLLGFLVFNVAPAKIYLGDAGSMLIGLALGCFTIRASLVEESTLTLLAPLAIWTVLFLDVLMAIIRRKLTGRSLYSADRLHVHHRLLEKGFSVSATLVIIGLSTAFCALGGLLSLLVKSESIAFASTLFFLVIVITTGLFGRMEFDLLVEQGKIFIRSMLNIPQNHSLKANSPAETCATLQRTVASDPLRKNRFENKTLLPIENCVQIQMKNDVA